MIKKAFKSCVGFVGNGGSATSRRFFAIGPGLPDGKVAYPSV